MSTATLTEPTTTDATPQTAESPLPTPPAWKLPRKFYRIEVDSNRKTVALTFYAEQGDMGLLFRQATGEAEAALRRELSSHVAACPAHDDVASLRLRLQAGEQHLAEMKGQLERARTRKADLLADKGMAGDKLANALAKAEAQTKDLFQRTQDADAALLALREETAAAEQRLREQAEATVQAVTKELLAEEQTREAETLDAIEAAVCPLINSYYEMRLRQSYYAQGHSGRRIARELVEQSIAGE